MDADPRPRRPPQSRRRSWRRRRRSSRAPFPSTWSARSEPWSSSTDGRQAAAWATSRRGQGRRSIRQPRSSTWCRSAPRCGSPSGGRRPECRSPWPRPWPRWSRTWRPPSRRWQRRQPLRRQLVWSPPRWLGRASAERARRDSPGARRGTGAGSRAGPRAGPRGACPDVPGSPVRRRLVEATEQPARSVGFDRYTTVTPRRGYLRLRFEERADGACSLGLAGAAAMGGSSVGSHV